MDLYSVLREDTSAVDADDVSSFIDAEGSVRGDNECSDEASEQSES